MPGDVIAHRKMTRRHIPAMSKACAADKAKRDQHDLCVGNRMAHPRRPCARRADRPRCGRLANRQAPLQALPLALVAAISEPEALRHSDDVGLIDTGNFNRAERVSRVDERIPLAMPYPAFILPTYADKGERRRTRKSRKIAILSAYRVRLRPPTSSYSQRISSKISFWL